MNDGRAPSKPSLLHRLKRRWAQRREHQMFVRANRRVIPWYTRFPGPVFHKEVWTLGKRPSTAWLRLVFVAVLLFIVTIVFVSMYADTTYGSGGVSSQLQQYQQLAPAVTMAIVWVEFIMLILLGIALAGPAVCDEKRMGTLATLLTTPLKAWQIVLGKSLGRLVELVILALVPVPLLFALRSFGGVTAEAIAMMIVTCLVNALLAVQVAIFFSTISKRATGAIISSLFALATIFFVPFLAVLCFELIRTAGNINSPFVYSFSIFSCGPFTLGMISFEALMGQSIPGGAPMAQLWIAHVLYTLGVWALLFWFSCLALRRAMTLEARGATPTAAKDTATEADEPAPTPEELPEAAQPGVLGAGTPLPGKPARRNRRRRAPSGSSRTVGDAPVMWRELQQTVFRTKLASIAAWCIVAVALLAIYYLAALEQPLQQVLTAIGAGIVILGCTVMSTGSLSQERESRTLEALLCTPLSAWDIVWGKFLGAARRASFGLVLITCHLIVSGILAKPLGKFVEFIDLFLPRQWQGRSVRPDMLHPAALFHVWVTLIGPMAFLLATGILFSSRLKKSTSATVCNMGVAVALWLVLPFTAFMMTETGGGWNNGLDDVIQNASVMINPMPMSVIGVNGGMSEAFNITNQAVGGSVSWTFPFEYDMPGGEIDFLAFSASQVVSTLIYLGLAWLALKGAAATLAGPTGRAR